MPLHVFFYLGLALLTLHEMDAIRCREWRIFPGLSLMAERKASVIFIFAHVPIFYWVFVQLDDSSVSFIRGFDIFMAVHVVLHVIFLRHRNNEFKDWISWSIIIGAGFCGLLDLFIQ